jgi:hypothetical protein
MMQLQRWVYDGVQDIAQNFFDVLLDRLGQ